jgi:hypothetical protein
VKKSKLLPLLYVMVAAIALAQVYKWVDEKGNVHFGDQPPDAAGVEQLTLPEGPSQEEIESAQERLRATLESRKARDKAREDRQREARSEAYADDLREDARFNRCVEARYQVLILGEHVRVFKLQRDWTRRYLENADRPAELARLRKVVDELCETDSVSVKNQDQRIREIDQALSIRCIAARERLHQGEDPAAGIDKRQLIEAEEYVASNCPERKMHDLWIRDWIFVQR